VRVRPAAGPAAQRRRGGDKDELSLTVLGHKRDLMIAASMSMSANLRKKLALPSDKDHRIETIRAVGYRLKVTG